MAGQTDPRQYQLDQPRRSGPTGHSMGVERADPPAPVETRCARSSQSLRRTHNPRQAGAEQLSNVVDLAMRNDQAATLSSCVVVWSSVTLMPSVNFAPSSTSATKMGRG